MAAVSVSTTPVTLDAGTAAELLIRNTGSARALLTNPSGYLRAGQTLRVQPGGQPVTATSVSGTTLDVTVIGAPFTPGGGGGGYTKPTDGIPATDLAATVRASLAKADTAQATYSLDAYGAKGDGRILTDIATTAGSTTITSATAGFTSADVGKLLTVVDNTTTYNVTTFASTIATVTDASTVVLSAAPTATLTAASGVYGSDDTAAIQTAIAAAAPGGGTVFVPPRAFCTSAQINVPGGVNLAGTSLDYATVQTHPRRGSRIFLCATIATADAAAITLGNDNTSSVSGNTGSRMTNLIVDAQQLADSAVKLLGRRVYVQNAQIWRGRARALHMAGQNGYVSFSVIGQSNKGDCVLQSSQADSKVYFCQIRQMGINGAGVRISGGGDFVVQGNHIFAGADGAGISSSAPCNDVVVEGTVRGGQIIDNQLDGCYGDAISIVPAANGIVSDITINGNQHFIVTGTPQDTFATVLLNTSASGSNISSVSITGNVAYALPNASTIRLRGLVRKSATGNLPTAIALVGNTGRNQNRAADFRPDMLGDNAIVTQPGVLRLTSNTGTQTLSGDGTTTTFSWAHSTDSIPSGTNPRALLTPASAAAAAPNYVTVDATNVTVTFLTAPPAGTGNVVFNWRTQS